MGITLNNNRGIALLSLVALTAMIPFIILLLLSLNSSQASHARYFNSTDSVLKMQEIKKYLMNQSLDIDDDGKFELPAPDSSNHFKSNIPYNTKDAWGHDLIYCAWDLANHNTTDSNYSTNNSLPPSSDATLTLETATLTGRIVSYGADGVFNTSSGKTPCTATISEGDDVFVEITQGEIGKVPGWRREAPTGSETNSKVKLITKADTVVIGESPATAPTTQSIKMEVQGGVLKATDGLVIQTTTTDPSNPIDGQIWIRQ